MKRTYEIIKNTFLLFFISAVCLVSGYSITAKAADNHNAAYYTSDEGDEKIVIVSDEESNRHTAFVIAGAVFIISGAGVCTYRCLKKKKR